MTTTTRPVDLSGTAPDFSPDLAHLVAVVAVFAIGMRQFIHTGLTSGYVLALLLLPVWTSCLRRYHLASIVVGLGAICAVSGVLLGAYARLDHASSTSARNSSTVLLLGVVCSIGVIVWARQLMSDASVALVYGLGMITGPLVSRTPTQGNAWKFVWAVPVAIVVLSWLAYRRTGYGLQVAALLALGGLSIAFDSRSYFATFLLGVLIMLWQARPVYLPGGGHWIWPVALMGAIAAAVYYLGTTLLVAGYLGRAAQARSVAEIRASGSLILGGRPEIAATWALMKSRPIGFGAGVRANATDILIAKTGLARIHYAPNNGYVDRFMFGGEIELHSLVGDLWVRYGVLGIALAFVVAFVTVRALAEQVAARQASALVIFLGFWTLWNLFFSPLYASVPSLTLTIGLLLRERVGRTLPESGRALHPSSPRS